MFTVTIDSIDTNYTTIDFEHAVQYAKLIAKDAKGVAEVIENGQVIFKVLHVECDKIID